MITRIKYTRVKQGYEASFVIPIHADLSVRIYVESDHTLIIHNLTNDTTFYLEECKSNQMAKRRARKKLEELGMTFGNESRHPRKKRG